MGDGTAQQQTSSPTSSKPGATPATVGSSSSQPKMQASYIPAGAKGAKEFLPPTAKDTHTDASQPAPVPTSQSEGPKAVRGWAPPTKEWDKDTGKKKTDQTRIEIKEEWDEDGNLVRTTIKKTVTPDWKWKTEKNVEIIPAEQAAKMKNK